MPYIKKERRKLVSIPKTSGELNFKITELLIAYTDKHGLRYNTINDVLGACEGAKLEFYRRLVGPYEDVKIKDYRALNNSDDELYDSMI